MRIVLEIENIEKDVPPNVRTDPVAFKKFIETSEDIVRRRLELRPEDKVITVHPGNPRKIHLVIRADSGLVDSVQAFYDTQKASDYYQHVIDTEYEGKDDLSETDDDMCLSEVTVHETFPPKPEQVKLLEVTRGEAPCK